MAPTAPRARWLGWDGRTLRWQIAPAAEGDSTVELRLDGVAFERMPLAAGECARDFPVAPGGTAQMQFSLSAGTELADAWRVLHGHAAEPGVDQWQGGLPQLQPLADAPLPTIDLGAAGPPVAIVVPIFNSPALVEACIASVLRWTRGPAELILIDDASDDAAMVPLLARHAQHDRVRVHRNAHNLGYTRSTNLGIELAGKADVVFLNSDTEVGPRWLDRLRAAAYGDASIGTVTAVSDNAGAFSVPELEHYCPIPPDWSLEQAQRALLQNTGGCLPQLPSGNGFCLYVKRALLDRVGALDAQAFPAGYGEENDLCQRGERAGFRHVIAGDVLVRHARSASFGDARRAELGAQGMAVLRARYPDYEARVGTTLCSFERRVLDYRVRRVYASAHESHSPPRPRILLAGPGARDAALARTLSPRHDCLILAAEDGKYRLQAIGHLVAEAAMADALTLRAWLARHAIELVHILGSDDPATVPIREAAGWMSVPTIAMETGILVGPQSARPNLLGYCDAAYAAAWSSGAAFAGEEVPR